MTVAITFQKFNNYDVRFYCLWCRVRVTAFCQIFEFLHPFQSIHIKEQILFSLNNMVLSMTVAIAFQKVNNYDVRFYCLWCRMRVTAFSQIFEFLHPFQSTHIKQQILFSLHNMVLSMTVAITFQNFNNYDVRFYCLWCRVRVTAFCQIFEFQHPFQSIHIKQQILFSLNNMVLSMTVAIAFQKVNNYVLRFYCLWCRMRVTAFSQIFEFQHPFQSTHIKQQILFPLITWCF